MDRKAYWIAMAVIHLLLLILAVNIQTGDALGDTGRATVGIIGIVILLVSAIMRLKDAEKSMLHLIAVCIIPAYVYIIGFYNSAEPYHFEDWEASNTEDGRYGQ